MKSRHPLERLGFKPEAVKTGSTFSNCQIYNEVESVESNQEDIGELITQIMELCGRLKASFDIQNRFQNRKSR